MVAVSSQVKAQHHYCARSFKEKPVKPTLQNPQQQGKQLSQEHMSEW